MHTTADPPAPTTFRYTDLPAADRDWLRGLTDHVLGLCYRNVCDYVRVGQRLAEARSRLKRRTFRRWVAGELPFSRGWAYKLMQIASAFAAQIAPDADQRIAPTALYMLAQASVPPEARAYACELAADGQTVGIDDAREILAAHRASSMPTKAEQRTYEKTVGALSAGTTDERPPSRSERAWAALEELMRTASLVHVTTIEDEDSLYSITAHFANDRPRTTVRRSLADAVEAMVGREQEKTCPGCQRTKPVSLFADNVKLKGERNRYCKDCERVRVGDHKRRARAAKGAPAAGLFDAADS